MMTNAPLDPRTETAMTDSNGMKRYGISESIGTFRNDLSEVVNLVNELKRLKERIDAEVNRIAKICAPEQGR
jgi:hypothetical protein